MLIKEVIEIQDVNEITSLINCLIFGIEETFEIHNQRYIQPS